MVYVPQPYVPTSSGNQQQQQQQPTNHQNNNRPQTSSNNAYAPSSSGYAPAPAAGGYSSAYTTSRPSAPAGTTTATSSSYGTTSYANPTTNTTRSAGLPDFSQALDHPAPTINSTNPSPSPGYGPPITSSRTPAYNPGYSTTTATTAYNTAVTSSVDAYQPTAIGVPVHKPDGYYGGTNSSNISGYAPPPSAAVAGGGGGASAVSALNSSAYSSGPTGGLVSEGNPSICHKIDYEIKGHEMQLVEIELDPQETVIAEAGAMMFMEDGIEFKTKFGDGSTPKEGFFKKLMNAGGRLLMGESLFITHFTNQGQSKARVAFAAPYPGTILPINMQTLGEKLICQKDAFLCAAKGTKLSVHLHKKLGSGLFGGEGFILQKLKGDGMAFVHAGGMVIKRELRGEKLRIDTGCVVAFTAGINFDIQFVPGLKSMFFGGEGLFLATLQGTGTVWMQSLPFSRLADRVVQHAPSIGGRRQGEGSALTGKFGDMVNGDGFGFKF